MPHSLETRRAALAQPCVRIVGGTSVNRSPKISCPQEARKKRRLASSSSSLSQPAWASAERPISIRATAKLSPASFMGIVLPSALVRACGAVIFCIISGIIIVWC